MWVWQSQAPASTSKFTGVDGWAAFARTSRFVMETPAAMDASNSPRRVSMDHWLPECGERVSSRFFSAAGWASRASWPERELFCQASQAANTQLSYRGWSRNISSIVRQYYAVCDRARGR